MPDRTIDIDIPSGTCDLPNNREQLHILLKRIEAKLLMLEADELERLAESGKRFVAAVQASKLART